MFRSIKRRQRQQGQQGRRTSVEGLEGRLLFAVFPVTTTADTGPGSLRQAITDANAAPGLDSIEFAIGSGAQTITPATELPDVTDAVVITGASQPGFAAGTPVITIDGTTAGAGAIGLNLTGGNTTVVGLIIQDFAGGAIVTSGPTGDNTIVGNVLLLPTPNTAGDAVIIGTPDTRVGGPGVGGRNVVAGIQVLFDANNVIIENNRVGADAAGTAVLAQPGSGISLADVDGGTIVGNVVVAAGVGLSDTSNVTIQNNFIGTNATGTAALGNSPDSGVFMVNVSDVTVSGNVISGNAGDGILLNSTLDTTISDNFIGTNAAGTAAIANGQTGITLDSSSADILNNVISGNDNSGITVANASAAEIRGNKIGTNADGDAAIPNGGSGVLLGGTSGTVIVDNQISGNAGAAIGVGDPVDALVVQSNLIGTDADGTGDLGNAGGGIALGDSTSGVVTDSLIGGTTAGQGNTIAFNDGAGVFIVGNSSTGNSILGNSIFSNAGLGIDLGNSSTDGRTANDATDADTGGNDLQNFPVLSQAISSGGNSTISGQLTSTPNTAFRIEFFSDTGAANAAEGRTFLGATNATTNASGLATFTTQINGVVTGQQVTATATDPDGNTSEFSDPVTGGISGPDIQVSGNGAVITAGDASPTGGDLTNFGSIQVGSGAISRIFTITNTGQANLDLSGGVSISGPGAGQFTVTDQPGASVTGSGTTTFEIQFIPTSGGNQTATVSIANNDPDEAPFTFAISGQGTTPAPAPEIEVIGNGNPIADGDLQPSTDDNTDFGTVTIGDSPVVRSYTITNAGQQQLTVGTVTIGGTDANQFSVTEQPAAIVQPGESTTFSVRFTPTATNQFSAVISIPSNDGTENPYEFGVRGVGAAGTGEPPTASVLPADQQPLPQLNAAFYDFLVRYTDEDAVSTSTFDNADLTVTGPDNVPINATFVQVQTPGITQVDVRYRIAAPGGTLDAADDGTYTVRVNADQVGDTTGNTVAPGAIGAFTLDLAAARTSLGTFGLVNGKRVKLTITEPDQTQVTISLSNGTGEVFRTTGGRLDLEMSSTAGKLSVTTRGGNNRAEVNDVRVNGSLKSLVAKTSDVTGVVLGAGAIDTINLGSTTGATISTPAAIKSLTINGNMASTQVFSGAILGNDGRFGGTGAAADTAFGAGAINKFNVTGTITQSLIAAGLDPVDDQLLNGNGTIVGGAASKLAKVTARSSVDNATVFAAGAYPKRASLGGLKVDPLADPRFDMTP